MKIKNRQDIIGLTLIEILIGIIITTIMMAAMYTSYSVVNQSYNQVSEKAKISRSSRDLVSMIMRDIRMAGFRYYVGEDQIIKFKQDTKNSPECTEGVTLPKTSYMYRDTLTNDPKKSHNPLVIRRNTLGGGSEDTSSNQNECCDSIQIVYEDFDQNDYYSPFKRYRITYYAKAVDDKDISKGFAVYKRVENFSDPRSTIAPNDPCNFFNVYNNAPQQNENNDGGDNGELQMGQLGGEGGNDDGGVTANYTGQWVRTCDLCTPEDVLIRKDIADMEFVPFDENGRVIMNDGGRYPTPENFPDRLIDIRGVDVRLTFRSKDAFFRSDKRRTVSGLNNRKLVSTDKFLRDSVIVTVGTRNIGGGAF